MFRRTITVPIKPGQLDAALRIFEQDIRPITAGVNGFESMEVTADPATNTVRSVTTFFSRAALDHPQDQAKNLTALQALMSGPPTLQVAEVAVES